MNSQRAALLIDRDYTVRADGAWVFTREYLLARGTCCGSRCLHCPYDFSRRTVQLSRPVISLVPSWTETLIHADANVVGRTRFCLHPHDKVMKIPSFGGTKTLAIDVDQKFEGILRDHSGQRPLVVLDKEENPREFFSFFSKLPCDIVVTDVRDVSTLIEGLQAIAVHFSPSSNVAPGDANVARQLNFFSERSRQLITDSEFKSVASAGRKTSGGKPSLGSAFVKGNVSLEEIDRLLWQTDAPVFYFIWKNPWMTVSRDTWIAQVLKGRFQTETRPFDVRRIFSGPDVKAGSAGASKYPEVQDVDVPADGILLFSSEPYPFAQAWDDLLELDFVRRAKAVALVDGERFSWFGIRAIRFLEER